MTKRRRFADQFKAKVALDGFVAERIIGEWITYCNTDHPHRALEKRTPDEAYFEGSEMKKAA